MVTFRSNNNNNRRPPFRSNNNRRPPFRSNNEGSKFSNNDHFQRKVPGRNNHNASKLIEKYNEMAREALANEDRVLSENYFQHADHFTRVQNEQESTRMAKVNSSPNGEVNSTKIEVEVKNDEVKAIKTEEVKAIKTEEVKAIKTEEAKKIIPGVEIKKVTKPIEKKTVEKKSAAS
jgi:hypothetical protein